MRASLSMSKQLRAEMIQGQKPHRVEMRDVDSWCYVMSRLSASIGVRFNGLNGSCLPPNPTTPPSGVMITLSPAPKGVAKDQLLNIAMLGIKSKVFMSSLTPYV